MLNLVSNRSSVLACLADCPADNHARQLALFLYEALCGSIKENSSKNETLTLKKIFYL